MGFGKHIWHQFILIFCLLSNYGKNHFIRRILMLYITKTVQIYFSDVFEDKLIKVENGEFHNFIATEL